MKKPVFTVSIIIPNWNGVHLLRRNLPSVCRAVRGSEIIVADDASTDGSAAFLQTEFPEIKVVSLSGHQGFAGTVNRGVAEAKSDIVVLINTDVVPAVNFLEPLVNHFTDPKVFAVGCLERSHESDGIILRGRGLAKWIRGFYIHKRGEPDHSSTAWVSGGSSAYRKIIWDRLGGMDRLFDPFYWEDLDISYRARKAGYRILIESKSQVDHYHGQGKISAVFSGSYISEIAYRNQLIFIWKNLTDKRLLTDHFLWLPVRLGQSLVRGDFSMIKGFFAALGNLKQIMITRKKVKNFWVLSDGQMTVI